MDKVAALSSEERKELFAETAAQMHTTPAIIEKDFWVVWTLDKIFADDRLNKILMFKGGTSLSKVFDLIGRFSEDIDLILDWNLVADKDPNDERSKNQQDKYNKKLNKKAMAFLEGELLPIFSEILSPHCSCEFKIDDKKNYFIHITYPAAFSDKYLLPHILLEIAPLAAWLPYGNFEISSYAAQHFESVFDRTSCKVSAIVAKRTFWEKATILHNETFRPKEKPLPSRYSRHYYDLAIMAQSDVKDEALQDIKLLEDVIDFKKKFYVDKWSDYDSAKPGSLRLLPPEFKIAELAKDYKAMGHMIFDKQLSFEEIIETLRSLEDEINAMEGSE
jgi:hypothetical protein